MSGPVDLGQTFRYRHTVTNSAGVPTNAGTVVITITLPDGTTATPGVVNSSAGVYDIAYLTTQVGRHSLSGSATGGVLGSEFDVWEDTFTVETAGRMLVSVDEASSRLRAAGIITTTADREQLRWLCMVASSAVERDLKRVVIRRSIAETHDGGGTYLILRTGPVISITTVVESGVTLTAADYVLDLHTGALHRGTTTTRTYWASGNQNIVVTYLAGSVDPPREAREVALATVQELWQTSQQADLSLIEQSTEFAVQSAAAALPSPLRGAYQRLRVAGSGVA